MTAVRKYADAALKGGPPIDKPNQEKVPKPVLPQEPVENHKPTAYPHKNPPPPVVGTVKFELPADTPKIGRRKQR